ncbi:MAG: 50S ribosomal protein L23 [Parcubacteria group bacterium GW2011_GWA2_44_15]|nr:MAG: 50S ribosomal protein L23 [Parcubacteria group bacterium GW2011_GWA2_44_15]
MTFLNLKKNKPETAKDSKSTRNLSVTAGSKSTAMALTIPLSAGASEAIIRPRVTEKATMLSEQGRTVCVFEISRSANKRDVADAVRAIYKVSPEKVAILKVPPKKSFVRGRVSKGKTGRKAYVYLKKGEKIEII